MATKGAQDSKTLKIDDLAGKLLTHEIHLYEETEESIPQQGLILNYNYVET